MKYNKINQEDVYDILVGIAVDGMNPISAISITEMAHFLKTSRYQVKKYIDIMKQNELVELKMFNFNDDEGVYPPYWGYTLTKKGRDTTKYKEKQQKAMKLMEECFGA